MADVFVSYSRSDAAFVGNLVAGLRDRGKDVWLDIDGIEDTEVFPTAIRRAIEGSDGFLFVITPEAVASRFCEQEVSYAAELGKRIVPALHKPVDDNYLPSEIRDRNWIPFTDADSFSTSVDRAVAALDTDLDLLRAHTHWLVKALEWDQENRDRSFLLRGRELSSADSWLARSSSAVEPSPTPLQREYVLASRRAAVRRQRTVATGSTAIAVVSLVLLVAAVVSTLSARADARRSQSQTLAARSATQLPSEPVAALALASAAAKVSPTPDALFGLRAGLDAMNVELGLRTVSPQLCQNTGGAQAIFNARGSSIAETSCDGWVSSYDAATGARQWRVRVAREVSAVAINPVSGVLAVGVPAGIDLLEPHHGTVVGSLPCTFEPYQLKFSPNGTMLVSSGAGVGGANSNSTLLYHLSDGLSQTVMNGASDVVPLTLSFSSDSRILALGSYTGGVPIIDTDTGAVIRTIHTSPAGYVPTVSGISGNSVIVAELKQATVVGEEGTALGTVLSRWSLSDGSREAVLATIPEMYPTALAVSNDGQKVAVGFQEGYAGEWSTVDGDQLEAYSDQTGSVDVLSFSPDGHRLAMASADGVGRVYSADGPGLGGAYLPPGTQAWWAGASNGRFAVLANGTDRQLCAPICAVLTFDEGMHLLSSLTLSTDAEDTARISQDGRFATVYGLPSKPIQIWNVRERKIVRLVPSPPNYLVHALFSTDDSYLGLTIEGGMVEAINLATGKETVVPGSEPVCDEWVGPIFSRDDTLMAAAQDCGSVFVWNVQTGRRVSEFGMEGAISAMAFDPLNDNIAFALANGSAVVKDARTGSSVMVLADAGEGSFSDQLAYTSDGRYIVTAFSDSTVRSWDARTGALLRVQPTLAPVSKLAVDGGDVIAPSTDGTVRLFNICPDCGDPAKLVALARHHMISPLTRLESLRIQQEERS